MRYRPSRRKFPTRGRAPNQQKQVKSRPQSYHACLLDLSPSMISSRRTLSLSSPFLPARTRRNLRLVSLFASQPRCGFAKALIVSTYGEGMPMSRASPCTTHPSIPSSCCLMRSSTDVSWNSPLWTFFRAECTLNVFKTVVF